jgi:hypothetical protein
MLDLSLSMLDLMKCARSLRKYVEYLMKLLDLRKFVRSREVC